MTTTTAPARPETTGPVPPPRRAPDPAWVRPALVALLVATGVLYLWDLGASGWANSFYSAAAQAGSASWKAFFFGSSDAGNSITVDKPPASLWVMAVSVRIFGLSSWSILVPQALMGVATTGVVYATVRRRFSAYAGLLAAAVMALTPVATLMFRFNNPDALLTLVMAIAAYAVLRATEAARLRWLVLAGALIGAGFLTKQLQVLLVLPGFALVYLIAAPTRLSRRIRHLVIGGAAMVATAGWWVAIVQLTPAQYRPYVGGSQNNSILELTLGYNGFGRLTGDEVGSVTGGRFGAAGGGGPTSMWGSTGLTRLFTGEVGGQIAWLIPAALILLLAGMWLTRRAPRTDLTRASLLLWGGWLVVTAAVFSFMRGIFHAYYAVALAPAVAGLIGTGVAIAWQRRREPVAVVALSGASAITAVWSYVLLARSPDWHPWLRYAVLLVGLGAAAGLLLVGRLPRTARLAVAGTAIAAALAGPLAYSLNTVATPHTGAIVSAGPQVANAFGPGGGAFGRAPGGFNGFQGGPQGGFQGGPQGGFQGGPQGGSQGGPQGGFQGSPQGGGFGGGQTQQGRGGAGGLLFGSRPSAALVSLLEQDAADYTWTAAAVGSNSAAGYQLATQEPVMAIGGFNGSDPSPTLAQFQQYVSSGRVHYFISGSGIGGANGGSSDAQQITAWVEQNFTAQTVDGVTVYDLSQGTTTIVG